jgi:hypothetical protein
VSAIWRHGDPADSLDCFIHGHENVWFLANPVTGTEIDNSWRSERNVTDWRYAVLESDIAQTDLWLRVLVQLHLPIAAIYTSGGKSVHALFRVDAPTKTDWDKVTRLGPGNIQNQPFRSVRTKRLPLV